MGVKLHHAQVRKFLEEIIGKNAVSVVRACDSKKGVTDEEIVKATDLKLNVVRSQLNNLHYMGLIKYNREKNQNTNWYTYTWFARKDKIAEVLRSNWTEKVDKLQQSLDYESNYIFYKCGNGCDKLPFELAAEYDFKCPECGNELQNIDNKVRVKEVLGEIKELEGLMKKL